MKNDYIAALTWECLLEHILIRSDQVKKIKDMKQLGQPKVFKYITLNISGYIKLIPYKVIKYT